MIPLPASKQRLPRLVLAWVALCAAGVAPLGGCASRADLLRVKQDQRDARALLADQQVAIDGIRRRLDALRGEMAGGSRGGRRAAPASGELADRLRELEARVAFLEQGPTVTPGPALLTGEGIQPPPAGEPLRSPDLRPTAPPQPLSPIEAALAKEDAALQGRSETDYREALQLVKQGQCTQAVPKLRDYIRRNPKSDFADNAQYWIGNCYYSQQDYNRAIIELNEVLLKYPKADRVPPALLLLADSFADSGDKIDARLILQKLVSDHPRSEEAERARQKLQTLGE